MQAAPEASISQATQDSAQKNVTDATADWGVKQSFRKYVEGPIAHDKITLSDDLQKNSDGTYRWSGGEGTYDGTRGEIYLPGTVAFTGHGGILETRLGNLRLKIDGDRGVLITDAKARPFIDTTTQGELEDYRNLELADVDLKGLTGADGQLRLKDAKVTLKDSGRAVFGQTFYDAGQELDSLSFTADYAAAQEPSAQPSEQPQPTRTSTPAPSSSPKPSTAAPRSTAESSETPAAQPTRDSGQGTAQEGKKTETSKRTVDSGSMSWGVKESFRKYIKSPIARASWTVSGVQDRNGIFTYDNASGYYDPATRTGQIDYPGTLHFTGHKGLLDLTIANARLQIRDGQGTLVADVDSRELNDDYKTPGKMISYKSVALAQVDLSGATLTGDVISAQDARTTPTSKGADAFAGFYEAGQELDPLSFTARLGAAVQNPDEATLDEADTSAGSGKTASASTDDAAQTGSSNGSGAGSGSGAQSGTSAGGAGAVSTDPGQAELQCVPVTVTETATPAAASGASSAQGTVSAATMDWGLKTSFRNYISGGIAKGKWDLTDVSYANGKYSWSGGTGTFKDGSGSLKFPGTLHFTGHKGILDTKLSDFHLEIDGSHGKLYATISSNDMEGKNKDYGDVVFANVDLSGIQADGGSVSVSDAKTTLTQTGADAFANFYEAGQELDPLSFSASLTGDAAAPAADASPQVTTRVEYQGPGCENLAETGAQRPQQLAAVGLAVLAVGAAAVVIARRRVNGRQR
ncbi:Htaa protein [Kocuria sp. AG109]|nr:Htaa protein [Kocuria sp. AG109]